MSMMSWGIQDVYKSLTSEVLDSKDSFFSVFTFLHPLSGGHCTLLSIRGWDEGLVYPGPSGAPLTPRMSCWAKASLPGTIWDILDPSEWNLVFGEKRVVAGPFMNQSRKPQQARRSKFRWLPARLSRFSRGWPQKGPFGPFLGPGGSGADPKTPIWPPRENCCWKWVQPN